MRGCLKDRAGTRCGRKFLVGAVVLAEVEAGEIEEKIFKQWLHPALAKPEDRALFGLEERT
jgi:hypothetical protein